MSNYTQIVSYGPKDSLSHGDPNKAIKGAQIDAELQAIATAISSKQDTSTSSGSFTATMTGGISASGTVKYAVSGNLVCIYFPSNIQATTNSISDITMSGVPPAILPTTTQTVIFYGLIDNNTLGGATVTGMVTVSNGGSFSFAPGQTSGSRLIRGGFGSGTAGKGFVAGATFTYAIP